MVIDLESLGFNRLNLEEKLEVVGRLWDEIVAPVAPGALLSDAQRDELHRRVAKSQAAPEDYVLWEEAHAATLKRLSS